MTEAREAPRRPDVVIIALAVAVGLTRLLALSEEMWEWDEALFTAAVRDYDVAQHQPHPPGFPLFIALARFVRPFTPSDFHALQVVNTIAAMFIFPLGYLLGRVIGFARRSAIFAALLLAFLPNVWYFGGTANSDISALIAVMLAISFLFLGRDRDRFYIAGCLLMGVAVSFRPQCALIGLYPWLEASWPRLRTRPRQIVAGALGSLAVAAAAYSGAALASASWDAYLASVEHQSQWVYNVDSFKNPTRPPLLECFRIYAVDPSRAGKVSIAIAVLAAIGLLRGRRPALRTALTFGPFLIFAGFMLGLPGAGRLSLGFMPLPALLATEGALVIGEMVRGLARRVASGLGERVAGVVQAVIVLVLVGRCIQWTLPALNEVRDDIPPTVEVMHWIHANLDRRHVTLYVEGGLWPFARYYLQGYRWQTIDDRFATHRVKEKRNAWIVRPGVVSGENDIEFRRHRGRIWNLSAHRYFEASVEPVSASVTFTDGWYWPETLGEEMWRWMGAKGRALLPGIAGRGEFLLRMTSMTERPVVTIRLNGAILDRFIPPNREFERRYVIDSRRETEDVLIEVSRTEKAPGDPRDLGLMLRGYGWRAVE